MLCCPLRISADTEDYQWNPAGYTGSTSQELTASDDPFMTIDFLDPVAAVGIDLRAYTGIAHLALMQVFAANDVTVLGTISAVPLSPTGEPVFFGWSHPAGIGKIVLNQSGNAWSPLIDNLEFYPIPEPAALIQACLVLATLWLARRTLPKRRPQPRPCD